MASVPGVRVSLPLLLCLATVGCALADPPRKCPAPGSQPLMGGYANVDSASDGMVQAIAALSQQQLLVSDPEYARKGCKAIFTLEESCSQVVGSPSTNYAVYYTAKLTAPCDEHRTYLVEANVPTGASAEHSAVSVKTTPQGGWMSDAPPSPSPAPTKEIDLYAQCGGSGGDCSLVPWGKCEDKPYPNTSCAGSPSNVCKRQDSSSGDYWQCLPKGQPFTAQHPIKPDASPAAGGRRRLML